MTFMLVEPSYHPRKFSEVDVSGIVYFPHEYELTGKSLLETQQFIPAWPERPPMVATSHLRVYTSPKIFTCGSRSANLRPIVLGACHETMQIVFLGFSILLRM